MVNFSGCAGTVYLSDITTTPPPDALSSDKSDSTISDPNDHGEGIQLIIWAASRACLTKILLAVGDGVDSLTANWPVPDDMKKELHVLVGTHRMRPLAVYKDDQYVHPTALNAALKYALVEVHFTLKHFCIRKKDAKPLDSFTGHIEQVIILKSGEARLTGGYKRKNLLEGPVRPKPFKPSTTQYVPPGTTILHVGDVAAPPVNAVSNVSHPSTSAIDALNAETAPVQSMPLMVLPATIPAQSSNNTQAVPIGPVLAPTIAGKQPSKKVSAHGKSKV